MDWVGIITHCLLHIGRMSWNTRYGYTCILLCHIYLHCTFVFTHNYDRFMYL